MEHALAAIVGMMFFVSGMSKAIHSGPFLSHIQQLGWVPMAMTPVVCVAVTGCELGLAAALLLYVQPVLSLPAALAMLFTLTLVSVVGYVQGAIEHCGCYGRWLRLTPMQGALLNVLLALMLVASWVLMDPVTLTETDVRAPLLAVALGVFMAGRSGDEPFIDMAPTRIGERWEAEWISTLTIPSEVPALIAFVNPQCKLCMNWTQPLKRVSDRHQWPLHVVVSESQLEKAQELLVPGFVIHTVSAKQLVWLVDTVPSVLQIRGGVIEARWTGRVPRAWRPKTEGCSGVVTA